MVALREALDKCQAQMYSRAVTIITNCPILLNLMTGPSLPPAMEYEESLRLRIRDLCAELQFSTLEWNSHSAVVQVQEVYIPVSLEAPDPDATLVGEVAPSKIIGRPRCKDTARYKRKHTGRREKELGSKILWNLSVDLGSKDRSQGPNAVRNRGWPRIGPGNSADLSSDLPSEWNRSYIPYPLHPVGRT